MERADPTTRSRALFIRGAGIAVILIGLGALFLPGMHPKESSRLVGALMLAAGVVEVLAGFARRHERIPAIAAGAVTALAALLFLGSPRGFLPVLNIVIAWLALRSAILLFAALQCNSFPRTWTFTAAGVDFLLALLLLVGFQISLLVVGLFGESGPIIATFAWVLAFSFFATGTLLLMVASDAASDAAHPFNSAEPASGS